MDCGDAGHILVSRALADVLAQVGTWSRFLHDLGEAEVKHGLRVHIYNLYTDEVGNSQLPQKMVPSTAGASMVAPQTGEHEAVAPKYSAERCRTLVREFPSVRLRLTQAQQTLHVP